jgi:hypothetical protein
MKKTILIAAGVCIAAVVGVVWLHAATPTVGATAVNPAYIVINTPTQVVVTTQITDSSLLPGGVNLLKVDAGGKTLSTIGVMHDDGVNGDAMAGDKTFSYRFTLNEPVVGVAYFRVSAAFKGVLQRVQSPVVGVTIDPFALPPDPGDAGKQTLAGIDSDNDGVRDDVQRYIAISQAAAPATRAALRQIVVPNQEFVLNADADVQTILNIESLRNKATDCLKYVRGGDIEGSASLNKALRAQLLNTRARQVAYLTADAKLSGHFFTLTEPSAASCNFDPTHPPLN